MYELDADFTDLFLRYLVADRLMLQAVGDLVDPQDFEDRSERIIVALAIHHWRETQEPISSWLKIEVGDYLDSRKTPMKADAEAELKKKVSSILKRERPLIAATKVHKLFQKFKTDQFMRRSMDEVLELQMQGQLNVSNFATIAQQAARFTASSKFKSHDITEEFEVRQKRREQLSNTKHPLFYIDPLDDSVRALGRKELALWLAPWGSGKSMALLHTAWAQGVQRQKTLHISTEDTEDTVWNRFDAKIADLPINQLLEMSVELRERFERVTKKFRGRIKTIDAVGESLSAANIDGIWERERSNGFIADTVIVDYDEKLVPMTPTKEKRWDIDATYNEMLHFAGQRDVRLWMAAQVGRKGDKKKIVDGGMVAEDIGKVRKATIALGIGWGDNGEKSRYIYVAKHRDGRSRFGVDIMSNLANAQFYDREATMRLNVKTQSAAIEELE